MRLYETSSALGQIFGPRVTVHLHRSINDMPLTLVCELRLEDAFANSLQNFSRTGRLVGLVQTCYYSSFTPERGKYWIARISSQPNVCIENMCRLEDCSSPFALRDRCQRWEKQNTPFSTQFKFTTLHNNYLSSNKDCGRIRDLARQKPTEYELRKCVRRV